MAPEPLFVEKWWSEEWREETRELAYQDELKFLERVYGLSLLARRLEERIWILLRMGQAPFWIGGMGHEVPQAIITLLLKQHDWLVPYYRDLCGVLAKGMTPLDLMLGFFAKADDPSSGGRQMPSHWARNDKNILSTSSPIATQIPHASGIAYALKFSKSSRIVAVFFGDGATSEGDFHVGLNFAGVHKLPVIFVCENNEYAISIPQRKQMAVKDVSIRAEGYGFPGVTIDGRDFKGVLREAKMAVERARRGEGPTFIEVKVPRLKPHSSDDDDKKYMTKEEIDARLAKDPLPALEHELRERQMLDDEKIKMLESAVKSAIDEATATAQGANPDPDPATLLSHVYAGEV